MSLTKICVKNISLVLGGLYVSSNSSYLSSFCDYWKFKDYRQSPKPLIGTIIDISSYFAKDIIHSSSTLEINLKIKLVSLCTHISSFTVAVSYYNSSSCSTFVKDSSLWWSC